MDQSASHIIKDDASIIEPTINELKKNFLNQKTKNVAYRKEQLQNLHRGLNELKDEFYDAIKKDLGYSDKFFANFIQISQPIGHVLHDIKNVEKFSKRRPVDTNLQCMPGKSFFQPEPYGVVLVISAWNYPYLTAISPVSSAIAAGNAVVLKPSELSPNSSRVMAKLFDKYLDKQFYRVIEGGIEVAKSITKQPFDLIIFTGGTDKGRLVAKAAAENLIPCILELGGKSPCIVDGSVDMNMACKRITQTKFFNQGQTCISPDYVLIREELKTVFLETLVSTSKAFYGENPKDSLVLNNMVNEFHTQRVLNLLKDCKGEIILGGKGDLTQRWIEPTIVFNPSLDSKLMQDEIFGPVLPVVTYKTEDEAIDFVNSRQKPLALYYYGSSEVFKNRIINETSSGGVCFNDCIFHTLNPELGFGGVGHSGYGAVNGKSGFDSCSHLKSVLDKSPADPVQARYPPYTDGRKKIMNLLDKQGQVLFGDVKKILLGVFLLIFTLTAYKTGMLNCLTGDNKQQGQDL